MQQTEETSQPVEVRFTPVSPDYVGVCWDMAYPLISKACETSNGRFTAESVRDQLESGVQILWILYSTDNKMLVAMTTGISEYPGRRLLNIMFCGSDGDGVYWLEHREKIVPGLIEWAKMQGCSGIEVSGREGWEKVLSPYGFKKSYVTLEMEI